MTIKVRKTIAALLSVLMLSVSACGKPDNTLEKIDNSSLLSENETKNEKADSDYKYAYVYAAGDNVDCDEGQTIALSKAAANLKKVEFITESIILSDHDEWQLYLYDDEKYNNENAKEYTRQLTTNGWRIIDKNMNCYEDSPELTKLIVDCISDNYNVSTNSEEEKYYSINYDEPNTEKEYINAAVACTDAWLTSLQSEDTDEYYRNKSFEINLFEEGTFKKKCNFLSCGMVNEKKEFVVEICFTAEDYGDNTFYDDYCLEREYTESGVFWTGQYICGRFRWENGECSLLKITDHDGIGMIQGGLNGIYTNEYKNFFEFARRDDYNEALDKHFENYGTYTVSKNLTQTEEGKLINVDIYTFAVHSETDDTYTAIWDKRAYLNNEAAYSTGLYFTDDGTGHMPDTLPKNFSLTFDNYNGDANPDFCCRYDSDDNGTFYVLDSIQNNGIILNISGRAFEGGIYIAGCSDPSPRLQKTDGIAYIGWKIDEKGHYYPTDTNGDKIQLPEMNMYSDRYYLPGDLKLYSEEENKVTCFLWNNTENDITTDPYYSIEINEAGNWITVSDGLPVESTIIKPRECAEITYDISQITDRYNTTYKIVQKSGELEAYGNFCLKGKAVQNLEIKADNIFVRSICGNFSVTDHGFEKTQITSAYIKDVDREYQLIINSADTEYYSFICAELPEKPGTYKLVVNNSAECNIDIKDVPNDCPEISVESSIKDDSIALSVTADSDCRLTDIYTFRKQDNIWKPASIAPKDDKDYMLNKKEKTEIILTDMLSSQEFTDDEILKSIYESIKKEIDENGDVSEEIAELGITAETDYNTFKNKLKEYFSFSPDGEYLLVIEYESGDDAYQQYIML